MPTSHHVRVLRVFGHRLRSARERAGFKSAQQFANRLGLEPGTYRCYERGQAEPNLVTLVRICAELPITIDHLLPPAATYPLPFLPGGVISGFVA
jgi:transcriptional regulator with XRE-family HTH domain